MTSDLPEIPQVEPEFRPIYNKLVRQGMYFAVRCAGYDEAGAIMQFVAITIWRRVRPGGLGGIDVSKLNASLVHSVIREFIVQQWVSGRQRLPFEPGEAYRDAARAGDTTPEQVRQDIVAGLAYMRAVMAGEYVGQTPTAEQLEQMALDPDVAAITDYMTQALTPEEDALLETRLKYDADFFDKVWPVVRTWTRRSNKAEGVETSDTPLDAWAAAEVRAASAEIPGDGDAKWRRGYRISDAELDTMWEQFRKVAGVLAEE
jgi:hypothetical protein